MNTSPFSAQVQACLPEQGWTIPDEELRRRLDLRDPSRALVCSVDPPGCVDIDDALHARPLPEPSETGGKLFEVGVHIADVGHFIKQGTPIDTEAAARATTVYLVNQRIERLSVVAHINAGATCASARVRVGGQACKKALCFALNRTHHFHMTRWISCQILNARRSHKASTEDNNLALCAVGGAGGC